MSKTSSIEYATYNIWANDQIIAAFEPINDNLFEQEIVSSFPSVSLTFLHLWSVEKIWFERLKGHTPTSFLAATFTGTNHDIIAGLKAQSRELLDFLNAQPPEYFGEPLSFSLITATGTFSHTPSEMVHHLCNHQTSHRGQLITMGRQLGLTDFPRTDYIVWARGR